LLRRQTFFIISEDKKTSSTNSKKTTIEIDLGGFSIKKVCDDLKQTLGGALRAHVRDLQATRVTNCFLHLQFLTKRPIAT